METIMNATEMTQTIDAATLFRSAYENRYTWNSEFPGFRAIAHSEQNGILHQAHVTVSADLKISLTNTSSDEAEKIIRDQVQEIIIHRVRRKFEDVHGKNDFTCGDTDASGAVTILVGGAAAGDRYQVLNNIVTLVHRHIHGTVVTINVLSTLDTGKGYLPVDYTSFYSKPNTDEPDSPLQQHHDQHACFGDYFILTSRCVSLASHDNQAQTQKFDLTEIALLAQ